jgi:hypothetical protein
MAMSEPARKLLLTTHVLASIGWVGALGVFLAHAIASLTSQDAFIVRAASVAMALTTWFVILPLSLTSLITGVVQALGTAWGLLRHYWVVFKLLLTCMATAVLLLKLGPIAQLGDAATLSDFSAADLSGLRLSLLVHAAGGLLVLVCAAVLAIYKPDGQIPQGLWHLRGQRSQSTVDVPMPRWAKTFGLALVILVVLLALMLLGGEHGPAAHMSAFR